MRVILKEDVKLMSEQMPTGVSPAMKTGQHPDNDDITQRHKVQKKNTNRFKVTTAKV